MSAITTYLARPVLVAVALLLAMTACSSSDPASPPTTTQPPGDSTTVAPGDQPALQARCGAVDLPGAANPVLPDTPLDVDAQAALDDVAAIAGGEAGFFDGYEWFIADRTGAQLILFGSAIPPQPPEAPAYGYAGFEREGEDWVPAGWGQCRIEVEAAGFGNAAWVLEAAPDPAATEIFVQINERECASGRPPVGREIVPVVIAEADRMTITVLVEPVAGDATCPGNPWFPVVVDLGEALGDRPLFDGNAVPPLLRPWPPTPSSIDSLGSAE